MHHEKADKEVMLTIIFIGFMFFTLFMLFAVGSLTNNQKKAKAKAEANKTQTLTDTFNGDTIVTIDVGPTTLDYQTIMKAAPNYGYKFLSQIGEDPDYTISFQKE